ncbi:MAG: hypothetical protein WBV81_08365 [Ignavibacteriaceae bacterium]
MSWFIGYTGKNSPILNEYISSLNLIQKDEVLVNNLRFVYGGKEVNLKTKSYPDSSGWIVSGIPVSAGTDKFRFMRNDDWKDLLSKKNLNLKNIDGHFAGLKWGNQGITFFNDRLGLRDIYFLKVNSSYFFSTRLDWIAKFNKDNRINIDEFSTNWLLTHKISWENIIECIEQLGPEGRAIIHNDSLEIINNPLIISSSRFKDNKHFIDSLRKFVTLPLDENKNLSLGLSGGLDSRLLIELLLSRNSSRWQTHTFGSNQNYDVKIARQISTGCKVNYLQMDIDIPPKGKILEMFYNLIPQLGISSITSDTLIYSLYPEIDKNNNFIIDGAYGEIFRRAFLVKLLLTGKEDILNRNPLRFFEALKSHKADIFTDDVIKLLKEKAIYKIDGTLKIFSDPADVGIENWLDNFLIVTKVPSVSSFSQTLLDNLCSAYMPFIQPSLLESGLALPVNYRTNGYLFRELIKKGKNNLEFYPLVKDQIIYPYFLPTFYARIYMKLKRKLGFTFTDEARYKILDELRDFIFDKFNSLEVKNFSWYDYKKIDRIIKNYYSGQKNLADNLLWWLTFELWRESFKIK